MACQRCLRWQRHMRLSGKTELVTSRQYSTAREPQAQTSKPVGLSIVNLKKGRITIPNKKQRGDVHRIDVSQRLGTKFSAPVIGAMEWQTSAYHYNKQTTRTFPVLANTTNRLIEQFAQLEPPRYDREGKHDKKAAALRRKEADKIYVSGTTARDYGSKVVIDVFVHDSKQANIDALKARVDKPRTPGRKRFTGPPRKRPSSANMTPARPTASSTARAARPPADIAFRTLSFGKA